MEAEAGKKIGGRKLMIVRHGERVDAYYKNLHQRDHKEQFDYWMGIAFDKHGNYDPQGENMPVSIPPPHNGSHMDYRYDTPITNSGYKDAVLMGQELKAHGHMPSTIYVSPALRSVQTACAILEGLGAPDILFRVEPALMEIWRKPVDGCVFLRQQQLLEHGMPIDLTYKPLYQLDELDSREEPKERYYDRSHKIVERAIRDHPNDDFILMVAHGTTLDSGTRLITGRKALTQQEFEDLCKIMPWNCYLKNVIVEEDAKGSWKLIESFPLPTKELRTELTRNGFSWTTLRDFPSADQ